MNKKELEKQLEERRLRQQLESLDSNRNRAQSVSIGMSASGATEITMRGENGSFLWGVYQPVQVTEFIHQLAASIGCHIHIQPRNDFGSWREWQEPTEQQKLSLNGFPPFAGQLSGSEKIGLAAQQKNLPPEIEDVATKKAVDKRTTKRSRTTAK
jgi:hypothetical protein